MLALGAAFAAAAPATAMESERVSPLTVANRGVEYNAKLGSSYWCYDKGQYHICRAIDVSPQPRMKRSLPARPGDEIIFKVHERALNVWLQYYDQNRTRYPNHPQPAGLKLRVWKLKVAPGIGDGQDLLVNVEYGDGESDAQFGFRLRRAK